ncbi:hypothetical protein KSP39_PZI006941 [Platanthera zijinensis]|uniref:Senescence regulator n=1 Tax=Platanthera zijinensis TaxID=2320716 RepID=A0AAP0BNZ0_9ASPA
MPPNFSLFRSRSHLLPQARALPNSSLKSSSSRLRAKSPSARRREEDNHHQRSNTSATKLASNTPSTQPVARIPNWANIYKKGERDDGFEEEDEDDEEDRVPPHVWIAKKMARSQISSFSVCEGAGRTLKGRDQRKVRDAVLTRTGFLE